MRVSGVCEDVENELEEPCAHRTRVDIHGTHGFLHNLFDDAFIFAFNLLSHACRSVLPLSLHPQLVSVVAFVCKWGHIMHVQICKSVHESHVEEVPGDDLLNVVLYDVLNLANRLNKDDVRP